MADMFEYESRENFLSEVDNVSDLYAHPEERDGILQEIDEKGFVVAKEVEFRTKNDKPIWLELYTTVFRDDKDTVYEGLMHDITDQKTLETQLHQARKMESVGTMAGGVAHDFNNILYIIIGNADLALEDIPEWNPAHGNLQNIKTAGLRAAGIVKQLLNFSRKTTVETRPIDAVTVIRDALHFLRSTIPASIEIRQSLPDTEVTILGDPIQINQVMMNLCTNASQVMEETGGVLDITLETEFFSSNSAGKPSDLPSGDYLKISITDTGPGIGPDIIHRIFDPYFTTKAVGKGSGMGLAVVHGVVKNHNGAITVDSVHGKGSTFTIFLPVVEEEPAMEVKTSDDIPFGSESILFVDDEPSIAEMTGQMLTRLGYEVVTATEPEEALAMFQSNPERFDLVITDMTMSRMNGVKLSERLKELRQDIRVIICTGHSPLIDEERAGSIGIDGYVMKPIGKKDLARTVRKVLDDAKGRPQP